MAWPSTLFVEMRSWESIDREFYLNNRRRLGRDVEHESLSEFIEVSLLTILYLEGYICVTGRSCML